MPLLRVLHVGEESIAVVCDRELLGKEFREGKFVLKVDEKFYGGKESSVNECLRAIRESTIANLVGSIVEHAIKENLIDPSCVLKIRGVPHAMRVVMK